MKAVLLLHGFATDRSDFARLVPLLGDKYDEVYNPNLPGHGVGTEKQTINAEAIMAFALNAFDALKTRHDEVDVFGFSMGGALATMVASRRQVGRLVLLSPANKYISTRFLLHTVQQYRRAKRCQKTGESLSQHGANITPEEIIGDLTDSAKLFVHMLMPRYTLKNIREFQKVIKLCNETLGEIDVPALLLWGKIDQLVPEKSVKHVADFCKHPQTQTIIYPDISHMMLHSRAFFRVIDDIFKFLSSTDKPLLPPPN